MTSLLVKTMHTNGSTIYENDGNDFTMDENDTNDFKTGENYDNDFTLKIMITIAKTWNLATVTIARLEPWKVKVIL